MNGQKNLGRLVSFLFLLEAGLILVFTKMLISKEGAEIVSAQKIIAAILDVSMFMGLSALIFIVGIAFVVGLIYVILKHLS